MPNLPLGFRGKDDEHTIHLNGLDNGIPIHLYDHDQEVVVYHMSVEALDFMINSLPQDDGIVRDLRLVQKAIGQNLIHKTGVSWDG